jgi:pimeloyl-ACP methyl ester carboxylesterase
MAAVIPLPEPILISARKNSRRGPPRPPTCVGGTSLIGVRSLVVLIHGYNVDQLQADNTWAGTRHKLERGSLRASNHHIAHYYWPGDKGRSPQGYAHAVELARDVCGSELASFLGAQPSLEQVSFVAHSLGCRLTLHTLATFHPRLRPSVPAALLMAAAVPEGLCNAGYPFARPQGKKQLAAIERVLYSYNDQVLGVPFRLGQRSARANNLEPDPIARRAVGRSGGPRGRWIPSDRVFASHGEYWSHNPDSLAAIAEVIGVGRAYKPRKWHLRTRVPLLATVTLQKLAKHVIRAARTR